MSTRSNIMFPNEARALRIQGVAASPGSVGTTNNKVLAFTAAAAAWQGTDYTIGSTHVAPTLGSGNWVNVVNDAAFGTTVKFNRRGVYLATLATAQTAGTTLATQIGITLDQAAGLYTVTNGTVTAISDSVLGFTNFLGVGTVSIPLSVTVPVYITDTLAGGAQAAAAAGVQGAGVLRFIANNNANGALTTQLIVTSTYATIAMQNDLAG